MIEMKVSQQDHPDTPLLLEVQPGPDRSCIDEQPVVDQKPAGPALNRTVFSGNQLPGTMTAQHVDLHGLGFPVIPSGPSLTSRSCGCVLCTARRSEEHTSELQSPKDL